MNTPRQFPEQLQLTGQQVEQICRMVVGHPDQEICGLLAGVGGRVTKVYSVANVADDPESSYYMDPLEQLAALKDMDERNWDLVAVFHSHPIGGPFVPSPTDIALSRDPALLHLIVAASHNSELFSCRAFNIAGGRTVEIKLEIVDSPNTMT